MWGIRIESDSLIELLEPLMKLLDRSFTASSERPVNVANSLAAAASAATRLFTCSIS